MEEIHSSVSAWGGAKAAAGPWVPFRPAPHLAAAGLPHRPSHHYGIEGFHRGGAVGSEVEQLGILVPEMVDLTSMNDGPLFSGPPPERPGKPMIHDPLFGKVLPMASLVVTTGYPSSTWTMTCDSGCFRGAARVVLMEGFGCLGEDRGRRRVAASA